MTSILIIENQEPGDCATCPLFFRNAGVCSWTMRFDGDCPLQRWCNNKYIFYSCTWEEYRRSA